MVKAGRPQGGPKGETDEANELAVFLRDLTQDFTVRELAERYKISKTSWGEYRSGTKTIHLHLLKRLVHDLVRDERARAARWALAQRLHEQATTAQQPLGPDEPNTAMEGVTAAQAAAQATAALQDAERLVHILLGVIAGLQMPSQHGTAPGADAAGLASAADQAATDLREAHHRLDQVRLVQDAVRRVRDEATAHDDPSGAADAASRADDAGRSGNDEHLPVPYTAASREASAILIVSRAALVEQYAAARLLSARAAGVHAIEPTAVQNTPRGALALTSPPRSPTAVSPPSDRSRRRRQIVMMAVAVTLAASLSAVAAVTLVRNGQHPPLEQANRPTPAPAASLPPPTLSPSPPASPTPSPSPDLIDPTSPPNPTRSTETSVTAVPDDYLGTWQGEFTKPGDKAPTLRRIEIRKGAVGAETADILTSTASSLCQSKGTLISAGTLLVLTTNPTSGIPSHLCTTNADITLRRQGDTDLTWKSEGTTATLHRTAPQNQTIPAPFIGTWRAQDGNDTTSSVRMTINQGTPGHARAEFVWDGDAHHCEGFSVLASIGDALTFSPETVTSSEPQRFCTQTPTRLVTQSQGNTLHVEWADDGGFFRSFTFHRVG
ncbi:hypothetical protein SLAV_38375 [Streptomyces lavendulae subsp. lavendulae]|uniref:Uncharacterized protein n=1 Tax=Streptomyces lavendulae subsp. lavendulae TaxID=58340 RepID=A0A2K8PRW8_STRLA|nr:hypothetical protein [Streptomyces lavendulae]ATZ22132.1 hypothetical protein SLAV_01015 [Streptomyces lavendulae subsp. lavendulae]ATZ29439.1 hypothetical protein SLAV_38375 [Streptomyces lavendulae subsp. lavendulae]